MISGKQTSVYVFGCRRQYIKLLLPQIIANRDLDEIVILVTASDWDDLKYVDKLKDRYSTDARVKFMYSTYRHTQSTGANLAFWEAFSTMTNPDAIYFKIDDDVLFISPNYFYEQVNFKIAHDEFIFQYPFVVNNPFCSLVLANKLNEPLREQLHFMKCSVQSAEWAQHCHTMLISNGYEQLVKHEFIRISPKYNGILEFTADGKLDTYIDCRPSINALCFTGHDIITIMKLYKAIIKNHSLGYITKYDSFDEEHFFTKELLYLTKRENVLSLGSVVSHYAYQPQRPKMVDIENKLLSEYQQYISKIYCQISFI